MFKPIAIKNLVILLGLFVLLAGIFPYLYYQELKEEERQFELFLNHFYHYLDLAISRTDRLIEKQPEDKDLDQAVQKLEKDLLRVNSIIEDGHTFLSHDVYRTLFFQDGARLLNGFTMTGDWSFHVPPLVEDRQLDEQELRLLKTIQGYMHDARKAMYSSETNQENPDLTESEMNDIILKYINKSPNEIYQDAY